MGKTELFDGETSLVLKKGWGYFDVDAIDLKPSEPVPKLKPVPATPVTPHASKEARRLLSNFSLALRQGDADRPNQHRGRGGDRQEDRQVPRHCRD